MLRKRKGIISSNEEADPMSYSVNIVDCMLVLALGFMLFSIMSMNMQNIIFGDMTTEEKEKITQAIKDTVEVEKGEEINEPIETIDSGSGDKYSSVGTVYEDPETGKLIMIPE